MSATTYIKIVFPLDVDEDGYPPISAETLNALVEGDEVFRLDNTPFFATDVALGDLLKATRTNGDRYLFGQVLESSGAASLSIIFLDEGVEDAVFQFLKARGCYCEYGEFGTMHMLAVSVPADCDYDAVCEYLSVHEEQGTMSYAELALPNPV